MQNSKIAILEYLKMYCLGRAQASKAGFLAKEFSTNLRAINGIIRLLRKEGILIGSSKGIYPGYYIPTTEQEIDEYLADFKDEMIDMLETFKTQKRAKKRYLDSLQSNDLFPETVPYKDSAAAHPLLIITGASQ